MGGKKKKKSKGSGKAVELPDNDMVRRFLALGLNRNTIASVIKNDSLSKNLLTCITEANLEDGCEPAVGKLVYDVATKLKDTKLERPVLLKYIVGGQISSNPQLSAALNYFSTQQSFNAAEFEKAAGVGYTVTQEEVEATVAEVIQRNRAFIDENQFKCFGKLLAEIRQVLPFADFQTYHTTLNSQVEAILGPRPTGKQKKKKQPKKKQEKTTAGQDRDDVKEEELFAVEKYQAGRPVKDAENTEDQLRRYSEATSGVGYTRFPPEPNGFLHLGHAKAMCMDFGLANNLKGQKATHGGAYSGGECYMRMDDTNPEAEEIEYIESIQEDVQWMGHKPFKMTYSSEYFQELHDLAIKLIKKGRAYVCHQTQPEIKAARDTYGNYCKKVKGKKKIPEDDAAWTSEERLGKWYGDRTVPEYEKLDYVPSPWRDRTIAENLKLFDDMTKGLFDEGEASLRVKGDLTHPNPNMWDFIAYRIKFVPHPHVGPRWCVYPSYDFTHCIVDSLEWVAFSCCTLEFENRRESYYWLLNELDLFKPAVFEISRLNLTNNVLSKRKLIKLVSDNDEMGKYLRNPIRGWDDPRLLTIKGLRRRGFPPEAINDFCRSLGITRNDNEISHLHLEYHVRQNLNENAPRGFAVLDPVPLTLANLSAHKKVTAPLFPGNKGVATRPGERAMTLTKTVYINRTDFREDAATNPPKKYFGLVPGKWVRLKYANVIRVTGVSKDAEGNITALEAEYKEMDAEDKQDKKSKTISWVSQDATPAEFRLYDVLFHHDKVPTEPEGAWLKDLNFDSEVIANGYVDTFSAASGEDRFQFERVGYFCKDTDSTDAKLVLNRTCALRETKPKQGDR